MSSADETRGLAETQVEPEIGYTAAIVTFRRPESLQEVLESLSGQSAPPVLTVVADSDPNGSAAEVVAGCQVGWPGRLDYLAIGCNLGPAGGWAAAVGAVQDHSVDRGEWVLILDDDDPLCSRSIISGLIEEASRQPESVAAVGLRGARLRRLRARLDRIEPAEGAVAQVDYLASGGAPLYRWSAIDKLGFFAPELFFGFEDLDYGLRLTKAGYQLIVAPRPSLHVVPNTSSSRVPWREYYKTRALVWILKRHVGTFPVVVTILRSVVLGSLLLAIRGGSLKLAWARALGTVDALRGDLGARRYFPDSNPPKKGE